MTEYFCKQCKVSLKEEKGPNINKRHHCGEMMHIVTYKEKREN